MSSHFSNSENEAIQCPFCGTYSSVQLRLIVRDWNQGSPFCYNSNTYVAKECVHCHQLNFWKDGKMVYPVKTGTGIEPNQYMPDEAKAIFKEAQDIGSASPRAMCALLRLCIEKMVSDKSGRNLVDKLENSGLPESVREIADACRLLGNNAVHAKSIDWSENGPDVMKLALHMSSFTNLLADFLFATKAKAEAIKEAMKR